MRQNCEHQFCADSAQFLCQSCLRPKNHLVCESDKCDFHVNAIFMRRKLCFCKSFSCVIGTSQDVCQSFKKFFHLTQGSRDIEESSCWGHQDCEKATHEQTISRKRGDFGLFLGEGSFVSCFFAGLGHDELQPTDFLHLFSFTVQIFTLLLSLCHCPPIHFSL